jgi:hypothetical protein
VIAAGLIMLYRQHHFIWCICISLVEFLCIPVYTQGFNDAHIHSLPAYAIALKAIDLLNSTICEQELQSFRDAVDQQILWGLKGR